MKRPVPLTSSAFDESETSRRDEHPPLGSGASGCWDAACRRCTRGSGTAGAALHSRGVVRPHSPASQDGVRCPAIRRPAACGARVRQAAHLTTQHGPRHGARGEGCGPGGRRRGRGSERRCARPSDFCGGGPGLARRATGLTCTAPPSAVGEGSRDPAV